MKLTDNHGRAVNYLRLAVTDRCNLRCFYCMPEHGIDWLDRAELMTWEEMLQICGVLINMGVEKIRITGGEPFARKNFMDFLRSLSQLEGLKELTLTTNGVLTAQYVPELKKLGIKSVNLSLDTVDRDRFFAITRRDELPQVLDTMHELLRHDIGVKINAVVMEGKNTQDIIPLAELTKDLPVAVRYIEEMPFSGTGTYAGLTWDHIRILDTLREQYPDIEKMQDPLYSTSYNYSIPGHKGTVGIIAAYTRSFCGTCNRVRITPQGELKTCLYGDGVLNVKDLLRKGYDEEMIQGNILRAINHRAKNGWEAEESRKADANRESMAAIGG
ncbi:MAG: GTP 3',8-cyclase MoaA [Chitinophagaceae bacterium]|nr:GTP 3',8-cyclase MoaA [Chitinophagaceae bacterium]